MVDTNLKLLFLDVETTGHDPLRRVITGENSWCLQPNHEIIEIGALAVDPVSRQVLPGGEFEVKVKPSGWAEDVMLPESEKINHYKERKAAGEWDNAVPIQEAVASLFSFCRPFGKLILGNQNFFFDWSFMTVAFGMCGLMEPELNPYFHYGRFDTRSMAIQELWMPGTPFNPSEYSVRKDLLCKTLGIPPEPIPHSAINGVRTAFDVWRKLSELKEARLK